MKMKRENREQPAESRSAALRAPMAKHHSHPAASMALATGAPFEEEPVQRRRKVSDLEVSRPTEPAGRPGAQAPVQRTKKITAGAMVAGNVRGQTFGKPLTTSAHNDVNARQTAAATDLLHAHTEQQRRDRHWAEVDRKAAAKSDLELNQAGRNRPATGAAAAARAAPELPPLTLGTRITTENIGRIGCGPLWVGSTVAELVKDTKAQLQRGDIGSPPRGIAHLFG